MDAALHWCIAGVAAVCCVCCAGLVVLAALGRDGGYAAQSLGSLAFLTGGPLVGMFIRVLRARQGASAASACQKAKDA